MPQKLTTRDFVIRASEKHGNRYDYSKANYINQKTRVVIGCPNHGDFVQLPQEHYYGGSGCPKCANEHRGMRQRLSTAEFVRRSREKHGDKYDYSKSEYVTQKQKVVITCPIHGDFEQSPANHYFSGTGCPECAVGQRGLSKRVSQERFIVNASSHFPAYDFSGSVYATAKEKVQFRCPVHGEVSQYGHHLNIGAVGCPKCGNARTGDFQRLTQRDFLTACRDAHGNAYDYSLAVYIDSTTPVTIKCKKHGPFEQLPTVHTRQSSGCPKCGDERGRRSRVKSTEQFIADARRIHGDLYDYTNSNYVSSKDPIVIGCPIHGRFKSTPDGHANNGSGCPKCFPGGFNTELPGLLYYLRVNTDGRALYKIGITNKRDAISRWALPRDRKKISVLKIWKFDSGALALRKEQQILRKYSKYRYSGPKVLEAAGNTELFSKDVLKLDDV